jgi:hypothetical protein
MIPLAAWLVAIIERLEQSRKAQRVECIFGFHASPRATNPRTTGENRGQDPAHRLRPRNIGEQLAYDRRLAIRAAAILGRRLGILRGFGTHRRRPSSAISAPRSCFVSTRSARSNSANFRSRATFAATRAASAASTCAITCEGNTSPRAACAQQRISSGGVHPAA